MGTHHHPISTSSVDAQHFFDQGLILGFAFNHDEAAASFREAIRLDPHAAMAYWGLAWVLGPRYPFATITPGSDIFLDRDAARDKAAADAIRTALTESRSAPENERSYIEALATRYSEHANANPKDLLLQYKQAMERLSRQYPDDLDAAVLYAASIMDLHPWQLWKADGRPVDGTPEAVAALEEVLRRDPSHPGANHLYIHVVEGSQTPELALASAERLMTLVPGAGHLLHMPAHIYYQTGNYEELATTNERAVLADEEYLQHADVKGIYSLMLYPHNVQFVAVGRAAQGRYQEAKKAADHLAGIAGARTGEMPMAECWMAAPLFVQLRFKRWDDILGLPLPPPGLPIVMSLWHFARTSAFAAKGEAAKAEREQGLFETACRQLPKDALFVNGLNRAQNVLDLAALELNARLAGEGKHSVALWTEAVQAQDALNYDEPPAWYYPLRESLGAALLIQGQADLAERVFREDLKRNRGSGRSLFGLMESLCRQNKTGDCQSIRTQYLAAWKGTPLQVSDLL